MSTTLEIGRIPAPVSRARSQGGEGPTLTSPNVRADIARAAFEVVDANVDALRASRFRIDSRRRSELEVEERRHLASDAVDRQQVDPVPRRLDVHDQVGEREHIGERRPRLGLRQDHDPGVIGAELELALGQDHPPRDLAAQFRLAERGIGAREPRARQRHRDRGARAEVPRAADDLARLSLPHVHLAELEPVGVRVLARLEHLADEEETVIAVLVDRPARLDRVHLGRADAEPLGQFARAGIGSGDVVAQPRQRDAHQNCLRTRRSFSQNGRRPGTAWRSCALRSSPIPNAKPVHSSGS